MRKNGFAVAMPPSVAQQLANIGQLGLDARRAEGCPRSAGPAVVFESTTTRPRPRPARSRRRTPKGARMSVAVADVDAFVPEDSPIDQFAAEQTTTVYIGIGNFPCCPSCCRPRITSLLRTANKLAVVVEFVVTAAGELESSDVYRAQVRNKAQLTYGGVGRWLEGGRPHRPRLKRRRSFRRSYSFRTDAARRREECATPSRRLNIETIEKPADRSRMIRGTSASKNRGEEQRDHAD